MKGHAYALAATRMFLTSEDVDLIREMVASLPEKPVIADLGAGSGTTAMAILDENKNANIHTIDISAENIDWARKNLEPYYDLSLWEGIVSDSVVAAHRFKNDAFDMVLLDTSHKYPATVQEIKAWLPKLKQGGVFWFHDYVEDDVKRAVDEAVEAKLLKEAGVLGLGWAGRKL